MQTRFWMAGGAAVLLAALGAAAQQSQTTQVQQAPQTQAAPQKQQPMSLAETARKNREEKKADTKQPARVFDNDSISSVGGAVNVVGETSATPQGQAGAAPAKAAGADERAWRDRFGEARAKLQRDQADLDVMQRELGKLQVQYYPNDPQKQMMQSVTQSDVNDKRAKIAQKQQDVQNDQAAISDLEDQLRKSGGDPGWAR